MNTNNLTYGGAKTAILALAIALPSIAIAKKPPEVDRAALTAAQSKNYSASSDICYASTLAAFQDMSYDIVDTDKASGIVKAQSVGKSKLTYNILMGFGGKKRTQGVTAIIESLSATSCQIRLNYIMSTKKTSLFGTRAEDGEPILDIAVYQQTFDAITPQVERRMAVAVHPTQTPDLPTASVESPAIQTATPAPQ